jgi:hypothetical protein
VDPDRARDFSCEPTSAVRIGCSIKCDGYNFFRTALFRSIPDYGQETPWRHNEDGVEHNEIAVARLNGDLDRVALGEQRLQAADDPTAGIQRQALGVEVDANEMPGSIGNFENEACDRYAVVVELALSDCPAEGAWVTHRGFVEVRDRHHPVAVGIELERWFR